MKKIRNLSRAALRKSSSGGLDVVAFSRTGLEVLFVTARPERQKSAGSMFETMARFLDERDAVPVAQQVFGSLQCREAVSALERCRGRMEWPVAWLEGAGGAPQDLRGTQVWAVSGCSPDPIRIDGRVAGYAFEDRDAKYCLLADLRPADASRSRQEQARETFTTMESALGLAGMNFSNVVRTWFFIRDILSWYEDFNEVRTAFFGERGMSGGTTPASTGVGATNAAGTAIVAGALAIKAKNNDVRIHGVNSPLQCPAAAYGSSFSRAVEVMFPDHGRLYVSGTASIQPAGKTAHPGDVKEQIDLTMKVVNSILESRQMAWKDVVRAVAYFRRIADESLFDSYCKANRMPRLPLVTAQGDICRNDLLFEMEVDAIRLVSSPGAK